MSGLEEGPEVARLLAGAAKAAASVRFCWLATTADHGGFGARPMGRLPEEPGDKDWTIRFLTDGQSHKAADVRRNAKVTVIFQHEADDAYLALTGAALLREGAAEVLPRWKAAYDVYFPSEQDRANAAFVEIEAERLDLWIRGVTPEPFGLFPTILERDASGGWRLAR